MRPNCLRPEGAVTGKDAPLVIPTSIVPFARDRLARREGRSLGDGMVASWVLAVL